MEGLGWWIYLCSIAGGMLTISAIFLVLCVVIFIGTAISCCADECEFRTAKKWWKYSGIIGVISMMFVILIPSKSTCYQIFGVTVATEIVKNSEALQKLPEKSFEAINRFLDSIASEDKNKKN